MFQALHILFYEVFRQKPVMTLLVLDSKYYQNNFKFLRKNEQRTTKKCPAESQKWISFTEDSFYLKMDANNSLFRFSTKVINFSCGEIALHLEIQERSGFVPVKN